MVAAGTLSTAWIGDGLAADTGAGGFVPGLAWLVGSQRPGLVTAWQLTPGRAGFVPGLAWLVGSQRPGLWPLAADTRAGGVRSRFGRAGLLSSGGGAGLLSSGRDWWPLARSQRPGLVTAWQLTPGRAVSFPVWPGWVALIGAGLVAAVTLSTAWVGDGWQLTPGRAGSCLVWPGWFGSQRPGLWPLAADTRAGGFVPGLALAADTRAGGFVPGLAGLVCSHRGGIGGRWHALNGLDW